MVLKFADNYTNFILKEALNYFEFLQAERLRYSPCYAVMFLPTINSKTKQKNKAYYFLLKLFVLYGLRRNSHDLNISPMCE